MRQAIIVHNPRDRADRLAQAQDTLRQQQLRLVAEDLPQLVALLACGGSADVQRLLRRDAATAASHVFAIALGRCVAWSGDLHMAEALRPLISAAILALGRDRPVPQYLHAAACSNLERLASDLGDQQLAARARAAGRSAPHEPPHTRTDRLLFRACGGATPVQWTDAAPGDLAHGPGVKEALQVMEFLHVVLGAEPDASRHRLRLQPVAEALHVAELPFGDGSLSLTVDISSAQMTCRVSQERGAIPFTLLLEPRLKAPPRRAWVDGHSAELQHRDHPDGGIVVPVQLVLDAPRSLTLDLA